MNTTSLRLSAERRDTMTSARPTGCLMSHYSDILLFHAYQESVCSRNKSI